MIKNLPKKILSFEESCMKLVNTITFLVHSYLVVVKQKKLATQGVMPANKSQPIYRKCDGVTHLKKMGRHKLDINQ